MSFFSIFEAGALQLSLPRHTSHVSRLQANFEARTGKKTQVVEGHRTRQRQAEIYADSLSAGKGQAYRAAPPGSSKHEVGAATDLNIIGETAGDAVTDHRNPYYKILADEAVKLGMKAGYYFKGTLPDPYHVEESEGIDSLRAEYNAHRLKLLAIVSVAVSVVLFVLVRARST